MNDVLDKTAVTSKPEPAPDATAGGRCWTEEIEISSDRLLERVKEWAADASVRRIRVKEPDGDIAVDIPLTIGMVAGGVMMVAAPALALIGALVAFFSHVKVEIVRSTPPASSQAAKQAAKATA